MCAYHQPKNVEVFFFIVREVHETKKLLIAVEVFKFKVLYIKSPITELSAITLH